MSEHYINFLNIERVIKTINPKLIFFPFLYTIHLH